MVISDFTGSNHPDVLVTLQPPGTNKYDIHLVPGTLEFPKEFKCSNSQLLLDNVTSQPLVLDYNGDMISDFLVQTNSCEGIFLWSGGKSELGQRQENIDILLEEDHEEMRKFFAPERKMECLRNLTEQHLMVPHSSAFVNLNKHTEDLTPDIFFNGQKNVEYIYNKPENGFSERVLYE